MENLVLVIGGWATSNALISFLCGAAGKTYTVTPSSSIIQGMVFGVIAGFCFAFVF